MTTTSYLLQTSARSKLPGVTGWKTRLGIPGLLQTFKEEASGHADRIQIIEPKTESA